MAFILARAARLCRFLAGVVYSAPCSPDPSADGMPHLLTGCVSCMRGCRPATMEARPVVLKLRLCLREHSRTKPPLLLRVV